MTDLYEQTFTKPLSTAPEDTAGINPDLVAAYERIKDRITPSTRIDGWTGARQKRFLEAVADGETVRDACDHVKMSPSSAYAFRRRASGRAFDLGWRAADLLARERVAANLLIRAVEGQTVEITRADGSTVTRHHYDNRLAVQMLNRLDRYADSADRTAPGHAARMVAGDFDAYLDLVGAEGGPARAGLYMLSRGVDGEGTAAELEPLVALARADRHLRCGAAGDVPVADLDPARRADWTAEQWTRAEAAGLIALAPPPAPEPEAEPAETEFTRELRSTCSGSEEDAYVDHPVWWDEDERDWRTNFAPPADFDGWEDREFGDECYERALTEAEAATAWAKLAPELGVLTLEQEEAERDRWFAELGEEEAKELVLA